MITKLNSEVIQDGSISAVKLHSDVSESLKTNQGFVTKDDLTNKINGKGLSTEDFTTALKTKLESLSNYDDTQLNTALTTLRQDFDALVSGDTTTAIKTFNEIVAFLDGIQDTQDLESIIASIEQQIAGKMDNVTLATVATSGSYNDLSNKPTIPAAVTQSTVSGWGFTKNTGTITGVSANGTSVATSGVANIPAASTSAYGVTKLSSATNSTSTTLAATASSVKAAYDLANGKQDNLVSGTNIKTINGTSILGSGDITISGGGSSEANVQAVDASETLDDVSGVTYVKYVAQTLTEDQKAQARTNIGALSASDQVTVDLSNYYTKEEIDSQLGDINSVLESIISDGGGEVKMISFTIAQTQYQAEEGMTWSEWVDSEYNTINAFTSDSYVAYAGGAIALNNTPVNKDDLILAEGYSYIT